MEIIVLLATIITIVTGVWFLFDKFRNINSKEPDVFIDCITFERTPLFKANEKLYLGKNTVLLGNNGTGKTAICEWLSALDGAANLHRWRNRPESNSIVLSLNFKKKKNHKVRLEIAQRSLSYNLDGINVPANPIPVKFVFAYNKRFKWDKLDDGEVLSKYLAVEKTILQNYSKNVGKAFYCSISNISFQTKNNETKVYVNLDERTEPTEFYLLSTSEQGRVIIELAISIAHYLSIETHTVLIIELSSFHLDAKWAQKYVDWVFENNFKFQAIFTSANHEDCVNWENLNVVKFNKKLKKTRIINRFKKPQSQYTITQKQT